MRSLSTRLAAAAAAVAAAGCFATSSGGPAGDEAAQTLQAGDPVISAEEKERRQCRAEFALCAPPVRFDGEIDVEELAPRQLVQIATRLDQPERLAAAAARRARDVAERGRAEDVAELSAAWESAARTLDRCRCQSKQGPVQTQFEKLEVARYVAARLPPAELRDPEYWAKRLDGELGQLRAVTRRSAQMLASGDDAGREAAEAEMRRIEMAACESVHAARDVLPPEGMAAMRASVFRSLARASGEATVDLARRMLERHEQSASCGALERPAAP